MSGNLPHADLLYVREHIPAQAKLAERYNAARAAFINARATDAPSDELRERAEALRDQLKEADRLEREAQRLLTAATQTDDPERAERLIREAKRLRAIAAKETPQCLTSP